MRRPTAPSLFGPLCTKTELGRVCTLEAVVYLLRELGGNCGGNGVTHAAAAVRGGRGRGKARLEKAGGAGGAGGAEGGNGEGVCQPVCQAGVEYVCGRVVRMFRVFVDRLARQSGRVGVGGVNVYAGYGSTKIQRMGSLSALPIALLHEVFRFAAAAAAAAAAAKTSKQEREQAPRPYPCGAAPAPAGCAVSPLVVQKYENQLTGQEAFGAYMEEHRPGCELAM